MGDHFGNIGESNSFISQSRLDGLLQFAPISADQVNSQSSQVMAWPSPTDSLFLPEAPFPHDHTPRREFVSAGASEQPPTLAVDTPLLASVDIPYYEAADGCMAAEDKVPVRGFAADGVVAGDRGVAAVDGSVAAVDGSAAAVDGSVAADRSAGSEQFLKDQRSWIFEHERRRWNGVETILSVVAGGWAANKFALDFATPIHGYSKAMLRDRAIAHSFGASLSASILGFGIDQLIAPHDMKMEGAVVADCLVAPVISLLPIPWLPKAGLMLGVHETGRFIDHYRQPKQSF